MSNKSKQIAPVHRVGVVYAAHSAPTTTVSTYKVGNHSYEMQNSSKTTYKDTYDGTKTTSRYTEIQKGGDFVDRRSGNSGYREEARFQHTQRVTDKSRGFTKEIQTEVKLKETTTFHNNGDSDDDYYDSDDDYYDSDDDYY